MFLLITSHVFVYVCVSECLLFPVFVCLFNKECKKRKWINGADTAGGRNMTLGMDSYVLDVP